MANTQTDEKEEIQSLINEILETNIRDDFYLIKPTMTEVNDKISSLTEQLRKKGAGIVEPILDKLVSRKKENRIQYLSCWTLFNLVKLATEFAQPCHGQRLAEMILWDEIGHSSDWSNANEIFGALLRIGSWLLVPLLRMYFTTQFSDDPEEDLKDSGIYSPFAVFQLKKENVAKAIAAYYQNNNQITPDS